MKKKIPLLIVLGLIIVVSGCTQTDNSEANQRFMDEQRLTVKLGSYELSFVSNERCTLESDNLLIPWLSSDIGDYSVEELEEIINKAEECYDSMKTLTQKHDEILQLAKEYDIKYGFENFPENPEGIIKIEDYENVNILLHEMLVEADYNYDDNMNVFNEEIAYLQGEPSCYDDSSCYWLLEE